MLVRCSRIRGGFPVLLRALSSVRAHHLCVVPSTSSAHTLAPHASSPSLYLPAHPFPTRPYTTTAKSSPSSRSSPTETTIEFDGINYRLMVDLKHGTAHETVSFFIDTGASFSQIDTDTAEALGLLGHPKLVGRSRIGDGSIKYDYLSKVAVKISDVELELVVKVGPRQPFMLGADALHKFGMDLLLSQLKLTMQPGRAVMKFTHIRYDHEMEANGLAPSDLKPISKLPPVKRAVQKLIDAGQENVVVDLGAAFSISTPHPPSIIDLGFT